VNDADALSYTVTLSGPWMSTGVVGVVVIPPAKMYMYIASNTHSCIQICSYTDQSPWWKYDIILQCATH